MAGQGSIDQFGSATSQDELPTADSLFGDGDTSFLLQLDPTPSQEPFAHGSTKRTGPFTRSPEPPRRQTLFQQQHPLHYFMEQPHQYHVPINPSDTAVFGRQQLYDPDNGSSPPGMQDFGSKSLGIAKTQHSEPDVMSGREASGLPSADILFGESALSDFFLTPIRNPYTHAGPELSTSLQSSRISRSSPLPPTDMFSLGNMMPTAHADADLRLPAPFMAPVENNQRLVSETEQAAAATNSSERDLDHLHSVQTYSVSDPSDHFSVNGNYLARKQPLEQENSTWEQSAVSFQAPVLVGDTIPGGNENNQGAQHGMSPLDIQPDSFSPLQESAPLPPERRLGSLIDPATLGAVEELLAMPKSAAFERGMSRLFKGVKSSAHSIFSPKPMLAATDSITHSTVDSASSGTVALISSHENLPPPPTASQMQIASPQSPHPKIPSTPEQKPPRHDWGFHQDINPFMEESLLPDNTSSSLIDSETMSSTMSSTSPSATSSRAVHVSDDRYSDMQGSQDASDTVAWIGLHQDTNDAVVRAGQRPLGFQRNKRDELLGKARELRERRQKGSDTHKQHSRASLELASSTKSSHDAVTDLYANQPETIPQGETNLNRGQADHHDLEFGGPQYLHQMVPQEVSSVHQHSLSPSSPKILVSQLESNADSPTVHVSEQAGDQSLDGFTQTMSTLPVHKENGVSGCQTLSTSQPEVEALLETNKRLALDLEYLQGVIHDQESVLSTNTRLTDIIGEKDRILEEMQLERLRLQDTVHEMTSKTVMVDGVAYSPEQLSKETEGLRRQLKGQRSDMKELQELLKSSESEKKTLTSKMSQLELSLHDSDKQIQELKSHQAMKDEEYRVIQKRLYESFEEEKAQYLDDEALKMAKLEYRFEMLKDEMEALRVREARSESDSQSGAISEPTPDKDALGHTVVALEDRVSTLETELIAAQEEASKTLHEAQAKAHQSEQIEQQLRAAATALEDRVSTLQHVLNDALASKDRKSEEGRSSLLESASKDLELALEREKALTERLEAVSSRERELPSESHSNVKLDEGTSHSLERIELASLAERAVKWQEDLFTAQEDRMQMEDRLLRADMELMAARTQVDELEERSSRLLEERDQAARQLAEARELNDQQDVHALEGSEKDQDSELQAELEVVRAELLATRFEISRLQADTVSWQEERTILDNSMNQLRKELEGSQATTEDTRKLLSGYKEKVALLELASCSRDDDAKAIGIQMSELRSELISARSEVHELTSSLSKTREQRSHLEDQLERVSSELQDVQAELSEAEIRNLEAQSNLADCQSERNHAESDLEKVFMDLEEARSEVSRLSEGVQSNFGGDSGEAQLEQHQKAESQLRSMAIQVEELQAVIAERDRCALENETALEDLQAKCLRLQKEKDEQPESRSLVIEREQDTSESADLHQKLDRAEMGILKLQQFLQEFQNEKKLAIAEHQSRIEELEAEVAQVRSQLAKAQAMLLAREPAMQGSANGSSSSAPTVLQEQHRMQSAVFVPSVVPPQMQPARPSQEKNNRRALWEDDTFKGTEKIHHEAILELESLQHQKAELDRTLQDLRHRYELSQKENDTLLSQLEKENKTLRAKAERLSPEISTEHLERIREQELEITELSHQLKTAQREREFTRQDMRSLKAELSKLKAVRI